MKFRHTNFMRLIYATLLALPFVAILSRVIYVQSNKNAYQSYYGETINQSEVVEAEKFELNVEYNLIKYQNDVWHVNFGYILIDKISIETNSNELLTYWNNETYTGISYTENNARLNFYGENNAIQNYKTLQPTDSFNIKLIALTENTITNNDNDVFYTKYNDYSYMDNVFEYSVNKFIENNNFGKINLFQWTTDLFFDSNDVNNMYVGFINWYLNYTLLVSATYILFLVLMWFINYARRLLERGMNYDW